MRMSRSQSRSIVFLSVRTFFVLFLFDFAADDDETLQVKRERQPEKCEREMFVLSI